MLKAVTYGLVALGLAAAAGFSYVVYKVYDTWPTYTNEVIITDPNTSTQRCVIFDGSVWKQCKSLTKGSALYDSMEQEL